MRSLGDCLLGTTMVAALLVGVVSASAQTVQPASAGPATPPPAPASVAASGTGPDDTTGSVPKPAPAPAEASPMRTIGGAVPRDAIKDAVTDAEGAPAAVPATPRKATVAKVSREKSPRDADAGPDDVVTPVKALPSRDPLDMPKPSAAAPAPQGAQPAVAQPSAVPAATPAPTSAAAPAAEALPPLNAAIKSALDARGAAPLHGPSITERRKERAAIAFFYAARGFAPVWSADGKPVAAVESVLARLAHADEDALTIAPPPAALALTGTNDALASSEIAMTEAVVDYARQATGSRVDPRVIGPLIGSLPTLADPAEVLDAVVAAGAKGGDTLRALNPGDARYTALRDQLAAMRGTQSDVKPVPSGKILRVGMHDPRVPLIRSRFGLDIGVDPDFDAQVYDQEVADAVSDFQRSKGIPATGTLNARTVAALSTGSGASPKVKGSVIANMEMWRWMPRDLGADRIEVNIPDYKVTVFHEGRPVTEHRVVVGKPDTPTPLFSNTMKYLIVNPYWNVPQSIIKNEMLPKGGGSLAYLDGRGYSVSYHGGTATVKQLPGDKNALGRIKFLFPNDYSVYLHDTPSKSLFAASRRAFSHGCVRVDQPFSFGEAVLNDAVPEGGKAAWSEERLKGMLGDKERYVNLPAPLPIHIEYFTASVDQDTGKVKLREDVYGYTHAVASALGQESDAVPVAGRNKPKPAATEMVAQHRRVPGPETVAEMPPPQPAARSFWGMIFDPR